MPRQTNIQIRRGAANDWTSLNPTLAQGELAMENDTRKLKVGDGSTAWNSLQYVRLDGGSLDEGATTPIGDPYFANVSLLLHMDGTGNSFADSSGTPKTITASGNATQSSDQSKWGGKSAYFDRNSSYLTFPSTASPSGTEDFAIECWIYPTGLDQTRCILGDDVGASGQQLFLAHNGGGILTAAGSLTGWFADTTNTTAQRLTGGAWQHIAFSRDGNTFRWYLNGGLIGTFTNSLSFAAASMRIGAQQNDRFFWGYIDDFRITKGSNRGYTGATIAVPDAAFQNS